MAASCRGLFLFRDPYSTLDQLDSAAEVLVGDLLLLVALISLRIIRCYCPGESKIKLDVLS
jgi:hypothetical protein